MPPKTTVTKKIAGPGRPYPSPIKKIQRKPPAKRIRNTRKKIIIKHIKRIDIGYDRGNNSDAMLAVLYDALGAQIGPPIILMQPVQKQLGWDADKGEGASWTWVRTWLSATKAEALVRQ